MHSVTSRLFDSGSRALFSTIFSPSHAPLHPNTLHHIHITSNLTAPSNLGKHIATQHHRPNDFKSGPTCNTQKQRTKGLLTLSRDFPLCALFGNIPNGQQLMQQIGCGCEESAPRQIQRFPPPGIRAQGRHDAGVVLQRVGDDVPIKRIAVLIRAAQAEGEALVPAEINRARARPGEGYFPAHSPLFVSFFRPVAPSGLDKGGFMGTNGGRRGPARG